jgi:hypothetical protein
VSLILGLLFGVQPSFGQTSFQWLLDSAHPRDIALANALVAAPNSAQALGVNPAGISLDADDSKRGLAWSLRRDPAAIYQLSTLAVYPFGGYTAAVQLRNVFYGKLAGYDADGLPTGDYSAGDLLLTGGLSRQYGRYLKFGVALGGVLGKMEDYWAAGVFWSAGMQLNIERFDLRFGAVTNYNGGLVKQYADHGKDELPAIQLVGLEKSLAHLPLTLYLAGGKSSVSQDPIWRLGGEFRLGQKVRFRLGVDQGKLDYTTDDEYKNLLAGISLGLGYFAPAERMPKWSTYDIQWGLKLLGPLGISTALSMSVRR